MRKARFTLGQILMTRGVSNKVADYEKFAKFVVDSLKRHASGDWGGIYAKRTDKKMSFH